MDRTAKPRKWSAAIMCFARPITKRRSSSPAIVPFWRTAGSKLPNGPHGLRRRVMGGEAQVRELVEHLFRHEAGQMLAALTHVFGLENLDLVEEVVQDALLQALQQWRFHGIPDNPQAWLLRAARNKALDVLRRQAALRRKEHELERRLRERHLRAVVADPPEAGELADEQLAMIFVCC